MRDRLETKKSVCSLQERLALSSWVFSELIQKKLRRLTSLETRLVIVGHQFHIKVQSSNVKRIGIITVLGRNPPWYEPLTSATFDEQQ